MPARASSTSCARQGFALEVFARRRYINEIVTVLRVTRGGHDMSARVLLVNPRITSRARARFPLSLLTLAAALERRGHVAEIVDGNVERDAAAVSARLRAGHWDALGVSVMGGPQVATALELSEAVRARMPAICPSSGAAIFPASTRTRR